MNACRRAVKKCQLYTPMSVAMSVHVVPVLAEVKILEAAAMLEARCKATSLRIPNLVLAENKTLASFGSRIGLSL